MLFWLSWAICILNLGTAGLIFYQGRLNSEYRASMRKEYVTMQNRIFQLESIIARMRGLMKNEKL